MILREVLGGTTRFDTFRKNLGIAPIVLTKRLAMLKAEDLPKPMHDQDNAPRDEHGPTEAGLVYGQS